uniref:Uncharacterized protein n=1 Tax=Fagus sylvatica TaxID=28930 RepID=A0A2N9FUH9_FAGSY
MVSKQSEPIAPIHTETHSAETPPLSSNETPVPPTAPAARFMDDSNPFLLSNGDNPRPLTGHSSSHWGEFSDMVKVYDHGLDCQEQGWLCEWHYPTYGAKFTSDLKERFTQSNGPRVYQLQKAIASLSQDQCSVSTFYTKLKALWDELINFRPIPACNCGALKILLDYQHYEYVIKFLVGLNDSYASIRGQILLMEPLPSINKVFALVSQEERQRELNSRPILHAVESGSTAFAVTNYKPYGGNKNFGKKERPVCSHCGITGHTVEKCYKIHGYPPGYKPKGRAAANQVTAPTWGIKSVHHCLSPLSSVNSCFHSSILR